MKSKRQTLLDTENFGLETPPQKKKAAPEKMEIFLGMLKNIPKFCCTFKNVLRFVGTATKKCLLTFPLPKARWDETSHR